VTALPSGGIVRTGASVLRLVNLRHLLTRPGRAALTVVGIAGAVALIVAISVINETLRTAIDRTTTGLAGAASLEVVPVTGDRLPPGAAERIAATPGVAAAVPISRQTTVLSRGDSSSRTLVFGVPGNFEELFPGQLGDLSGQLAAPEFRSGVLLSEELTDALDAAPGGHAEITTASGPKPAAVTGVVAHSPFAAVNGGNFALLPLQRAEKVFEQTGQPNVVYLTTGKNASPSSVATRLQQELGYRTLVQPPGSAAKAYEKAFDSIASISEQARVVALLVALFLVYNTMSMALAERRRELTLLTLGGAERRAVMGAFVVEALVLGIVGSAVGVAAGIGIGRLLAQRTADSYTALPFVTSGSLQVGLGTVLLGLGAGIAVAVVGAIVPGRRILRVKPIEALRPIAAYEATSEGRRRLAPLAVIWSSLVAVLRRVYRALFGTIGRLAADNLERNPGRVTIAVGALALSTAVAIAVGSSLGSYHREVSRAVSAWFVAPLYVAAPGSAGYRSDQPLSDSFAKELARVPGVKAAYPVRFGLIDDGGTQTILYAMPIAKAARNGERISEGVGISQQALTAALGRGEVVVSRYMARHRHLHEGELLSLPGFPSPLRIGGLFNDIAAFDSLYIELSDYRRATGDDLANRFVITTAGNGTDAVSDQLASFLRQRQVPAVVLTRDELQAELVESIDSLFSLAKGVQVAALLIAGLIVLNTMLTASFERRREFGLERTFGMSRSQLAASVLLEAVGIALIAACFAAVLGIGLGYLMTLTIEQQLAWQISYSPALATTLVALGASLVVGAAAALYPAWLSTRQRLIELVQFE
jgi:putative ABC transport system permease protein